MRISKKKKEKKIVTAIETVNRSGDNTKVMTDLMKLFELRPDGEGWRHREAVQVGGSTRA